MQLEEVLNLVYLILHPSSATMDLYLSLFFNGIIQQYQMKNGQRTKNKKKSDHTYPTGYWIYITYLHVLEQLHHRKIKCRTCHSNVVEPHLFCQTSKFFLCPLLSSCIHVHHEHIKLKQAFSRNTSFGGFRDHHINHYYFSMVWQCLIAVL